MRLAQAGLIWTAILLNLITYCLPRLYGRRLTDLSRRNVLKNTFYRWPNGNVPYVFDNALPSEMKSFVLKMMAVFEKRTCIRFIPRRKEPDFILISKGEICFADVGRLGIGMQDLSLNKECMVEEAIQHELMHALGFFHEHSRCDRDKYVYIFEDNIKKDFLQSNYGKRKCEKTETFDLPYDYNSIMHYGGGEFSVDPQKPTILSRRNPYQKMGNNKLSDLDVLRINKAYDCSN